MHFLTGTPQGPKKKITYVNGLLYYLNVTQKRKERQTEKDKNRKKQKNLP